MGCRCKCIGPSHDSRVSSSLTQQGTSSPARRRWQCELHRRYARRTPRTGHGDDTPARCPGTHRPLAGHRPRHVRTRGDRPSRSNVRSGVLTCQRRRASPVWRCCCAMSGIASGSSRTLTRAMYASPGYERVWGRSCASLYEDSRSFMEAIHPDDLLAQRAGVMSITETASSRRTVPCGGCGTAAIR